MNANKETEGYAEDSGEITFGDYAVLDIVPLCPAGNVKETAQQPHPHHGLAVAALYSSNTGRVWLFEESSVSHLAGKLVESFSIVGHDLENEYAILRSYKGTKEALEERCVDMDLRKLMADAEPGLSPGLDELCKANFGLARGPQTSELQKLWAQGDKLKAVEGCLTRVLRKLQLYQALLQCGFLYVAKPEYHRVDLPWLKIRCKTGDPDVVSSNIPASFDIATPKPE